MDAPIVLAAFDDLQRQYQAVATPSAIQADLQSLVSVQAQISQQLVYYRGQRNTWVWLAVAIFAVILVTQWLVSVSGFWLLLGLPALAIALGAGVYAIVKAVQANDSVQSWRSRDFEAQGYRHQALSRLLTLIARDILPQAKLRLHLDLSPLTAMGKSVGKGKNPRHPTRTNEYFADPWLNFRGRFADGTRFQITAVEYYVVCTWRNENNNARRREKHKGLRLQLLLRYAPEQYADLPRLANGAEAAVQLPRYVALQHLDVQGDRLEMKVKLPGKVTASLLAQTLTLMLLSAYQILNLARLRNHQAS